MIRITKGDGEAVAALSGHADIDVLLKTYSHEFDAARGRHGRAEGSTDRCCLRRLSVTPCDPQRKTAPLGGRFGLASGWFDVRSWHDL
jgi:hypothetical protein